MPQSAYLYFSLLTLSSLNSSEYNSEVITKVNKGLVACKRGTSDFRLFLLHDCCWSANTLCYVRGQRSSFRWELQRILGMKDSGAKTQTQTGGYLFLVGPRVSVHTVRRLLRNKRCCWATCMYLFEEDVVHDDHGGHVGVGAPHHSELRRLARTWSLQTFLDRWAGRVLRVGGVHRAHMLRAGI